MSALPHSSSADGSTAVGPAPGDVRRMFAEVAPRYDFINRALSGGIDVLWRRKTVAAGLGTENGDLPRVLDVCTGTADLALSFAARGCEVVGADFCLEMLGRGRDKVVQRGAESRLRLVAADTLHLPFADESFDVCSVAFGIRNVADPVAGLAEMARVLRPGGRVLVLEFSRPRTPVLGKLYLWYFRRVLPKLGALLSPRSRSTSAYDYLPTSVMAFPDRDDFLALMQRAGLVEPRYDLFSIGIASLYVGVKPARVTGVEARG